MKHVVIGMAIALMAVSMVSAQAKDQAAPSASDKALAEVRQAIDKGNAQWIEGWAKGDAAMVAAIFADDGVQLAGSGKIFKGPQQIRERQKAAMQGAEKGKPGVDEGRYVTIWKRQKDGSWKLAMDMGVPQG
jgi:ketosteroid isomerase-like protein